MVVPMYKPLQIHFFAPLIKHPDNIFVFISVSFVRKVVMIKKKEFFMNYYQYVLFFCSLLH